MKSTEMVKRRHSESAFYLGTSTNGHMLPVNVMSGFIQKYFLQHPWNPKNSLVAKRTIGGGTLGPDGFMGRIWRPGDHIQQQWIGHLSYATSSFVHHFIAICVNSNWSYSPETAKLGFDLSDLDLWPQSMTLCLSIISVNGNNSWKFDDDTVMGS